MPRCGTHINKTTKTGWKLYSAERPDLSAKIKKDQQCFYHDNQTGLETIGKSLGHIQTLPLVQVHTSHGSHKHGQNLTSQADNKICTRKSCEISFTHPTVKKDWYKHSFLPRTMTEWNLLPPNRRQSTSVDSLKSKLNNMDLTSLSGGPTIKIYSTSHKRACNSISRLRSLFQYPIDTDTEWLGVADIHNKLIT